MAESTEKTAIILLVEDDPGDQELTRRALEEGKFLNELYIVNDGEEALDYLYRRGKYEDTAASPTPDLILLDLNLPKIDGRDVLRQIEDEPRLALIPVVVLTTSKQEEDILRSYKLGVKSFITKPVNMNSFMEIIRVLGEYWFKIVVLPPVE